MDFLCCIARVRKIAQIGLEQGAAAAAAHRDDGVAHKSFTIGILQTAQVQKVDEEGLMNPEKP